MERFFSYKLNEKGYVVPELDVRDEERVENLKLTAEQLAELTLWHALDYLLLDRAHHTDARLRNLLHDEYDAAQEVLSAAIMRRRGANRLAFIEPRLKVL